MNDNRIVTKIEEHDKKRCKIYLNEEFAFLLYKGELSEYKIVQGNIITDDIYNKITEETLLKRAKKRSLNFSRSLYSV